MDIQVALLGVLVSTPLRYATRDRRRTPATQLAETLGRAGRARAAREPRPRRLCDECRPPAGRPGAAIATGARRGVRARRGGAHRRSNGPRSRGPGFVNLWLAPAWYGEALGEILERGEDYGGGWAAPPSGSRWSWCPRTRRGRSRSRRRATARTATPSRGCSRSPATTSSSSTTTTTRARRWTGSAPRSRRCGEGEEPPEDGYRGAYVAELARMPGDPVEPMRAQIEATLERFRVHVDTWALQSEMERHVPEVLTGSRRTRPTAPSGRRPRSTATTRTARSSARSDGSFLYYAADIAYLARQARARVRARDLRPGRRPPRLRRAASGARPARRGSRARRGAALPARPPRPRRRADEDLEAPRRRRLPRRLMDDVGVDAARWFLVNRGPDRTIEIDVDLAAEKTQKNPVYYVQYAHARIAGILRNAGDAAISPEPPAGARGRGAGRSSSDWRTSRRWCARRRSGAGRTRCPSTRSGSPTTSIASTTSTACSRATSRRSASRSRGDADSCWRGRSTSSASRRPSGCSGTHGSPRAPPSTG